MAEHRATPEQWAITEEYANAAIGCYYDSCILELRDRLAAAEQRISELEGNRQASLDSSAPAGSLVEVVEAVARQSGGYLARDEWSRVILAAADWIEQWQLAKHACVIPGAREVIDWLREEVKRHG